MYSFISAVPVRPLSLSLSLARSLPVFHCRSFALALAQSFSTYRSPIAHRSISSAPLHSHLPLSALPLVRSFSSFPSVDYSRFEFYPSLSPAEQRNFQLLIEFLYSQQCLIELGLANVNIPPDSFDYLVHSWLKAHYSPDSSPSSLASLSLNIESNDPSALRVISSRKRSIVSSIVAHYRSSSPAAQADSQADDSADPALSEAEAEADTDDSIGESIETNFLSPDVEQSLNRSSRPKRKTPAYDPALQEFSDCREPHEWFQLARSMKRKIILHIGPTNSGKTYHAMKRLKEAESGAYIGPLRLLAWEVHEKLTTGGVPCSLLTGQEQIRPPGARHTASTAELLDSNSMVEVGVIDECQMLSAPDRGGYWTRAVLGFPAKELHICGDPSIRGLVSALVETTGDSLEIVQHKRLTPLNLTSPLGTLKRVQKGDCIIAFSRTRLYKLKHAIEQQTRLKVGIIYGSLPPETRKAQAAQFNDPAGEYDVLVASDAIGMGLNLHIRRIIFDSIEKFDGVRSRLLTPGEALQIAGRAGRFKIFSQGLVTTLRLDEYHELKKLLLSKLPPTTKAGILPSWEQIESISNLRPEFSFSSILRYFAKYGIVDELYFLCNLDQLLEISDLIHAVPLSLRDRYWLALAPADVEVPIIKGAMLHFATNISTNSVITLEFLKTPIMRLQGQKSPPLLLEELETLWNVLDLYSWLAKKFNSDRGELFVEVARAEELRSQAAKQIEKQLGEPRMPTRNRNRNGNQNWNRDENRSANRTFRERSREQGLEAEQQLPRARQGARPEAVRPRPVNRSSELNDEELMNQVLSEIRGNNPK